MCGAYEMLQMMTETNFNHLTRHLIILILLYVYALRVKTKIHTLHDEERRTNSGFASELTSYVDRLHIKIYVTSTRPVQIHYSLLAK